MKPKTTQVILLTGNHSLRSNQEFDWAVNIRDSVYHSFTFTKYDRSGRPISNFKGIIQTQRLFDVLIENGLIKED